MKTELERYLPYQVYLLNDSQYVLITSVDPISRIKPTDKDRMVECIFGTKFKKGDEFKDYSVIIENAPMNISITLGCKVKKTSIAELKSYEAKYIGTLTEEKVKQYHKIHADYINSL